MLPVRPAESVLLAMMAYRTFTFTTFSFISLSKTHVVEIAASRASNRFTTKNGHLRRRIGNPYLTPTPLNILESQLLSFLGSVFDKENNL